MQNKLTLLYFPEHPKFKSSTTTNLLLNSKYKNKEKEAVDDPFLWKTAGASVCNFRSDRLKEQFFSRSHQSCFFSRSRTRINLAKTNVYMSWETARLACPVSSLKTLYCSLLKRCCLAGKAVFECQSERRCKMLNAVVCAF